MGVYITDVHLTGVHFIGVYLIGVYVTGVHLMGVCLNVNWRIFRFGRYKSRRRPHPSRRTSWVFGCSDTLLG